MKKLIFSVFMVSLLCLCTVGFVGTLAAGVLPPAIGKVLTSGPDVDIDGNIDIVVETKQTAATGYKFTIIWDNGGSNIPVIIKDTVPAEWNIIDINFNPDPVQEKDVSPSLTAYNDGNSGTFTVFRSGKRSKGTGNEGPKKNNSSTQICWTPDPDAAGLVFLVVTVETRNSPSSRGKKSEELKYAPTSCGLLILNNGATAYESPLEDPPVEIDVPSNPTDPIGLIAIADIADGLVSGGGYPRDGSGDRDGDGIIDFEEVFIWGTDPCDPDSDDDGLGDAIEILGCTNPLKKDTDDDGLEDGVETATGTFVDVDDTGSNPCIPDTDGDLCNDGDEVDLGSNPNDDTSNNCT